VTVPIEGPCVLLLLLSEIVDAVDVRRFVLDNPDLNVVDASLIVDMDDMVTGCPQRV
jgi:hypothetical protein